jgi:flagellar basal body-associated protein FliL
MLFWQGVPINTKPTPDSSEFSSYFLILIASILSFIFGVLVTTIFFVSKSAASKPRQVATQPNTESDNLLISIKQCPKCNSTYTDEDLTYCLRDGLTLKVVGKMPIPVDSDKTLKFKN